MFAKEVDFWKYCWKCEHKDLQPYEEPCNGCMTVCAREFSHVPVYFKEKEGAKRDRKGTKARKGLRRAKSRNTKQG